MSLAPKIEELLTLEPNWDSYNADRIDRGAAEKVDALLRLLSAPPGIVPMSDGGVALEWHIGPSEFAIQVPNTKTRDPISVFCHDDITDDEWEALAVRTK